MSLSQDGPRSAQAAQTANPQDPSNEYLPMMPVTLAEENESIVASSVDQSFREITLAPGVQGGSAAATSRPTTASRGTVVVTARGHRNSNRGSSDGVASTVSLGFGGGAEDSQNQASESSEEVLPAGDTVFAVLAWMVLVPERGTRVARFLMYWDFMTCILLMVCAYSVPFGLALPSVAERHLKYFDILADILFSMDFGLHFLLAFKHHAEGHQENIWEKDPGRIAWRYMHLPMDSSGGKGWFWIDIASVLPGWVELVTGASGMQIFRLTRALRLIRIMRLARVSRKVQDAQAMSGLKFYLSDIVSFVFITTFVSHCAACIWVLLERAQGRSPPGDDGTEVVTWLSALRAAKGDCCTPSAEEDPMCVYQLALYWAIMTLTSVGYGDITPQNSREYSVCTLFMLISGFVWAYIVGSVVSLLSSLNHEQDRFKATMDRLSGIMGSWKLSSSHRFKLREYMLIAKDISCHARQQQLLEENLSEGLQRKILLESPILGVIQTKVYWAAALEQDALLEIIRCLDSAMYAKDETIPARNKMIIVRMGIVAIGGRILGRNSVYGENSILLVTDQLISGPMPRTLSYVAVLTLDQASLIRVCEQYPSADERLRRAQARTAVWRGFVLHGIKEQRRLNKSSMIEEARIQTKLGFVAATQRSSIFNALKTDDVKAVEASLAQQHTELKDQLAATRGLVEEQMNCVLTMSKTVSERSGGRSSSDRRAASPKATAVRSQAHIVAASAVEYMQRLTARSRRAETSPRSPSAPGTSSEAGGAPLSPRPRMTDKFGRFHLSKGIRPIARQHSPPVASPSPESSEMQARDDSRQRSEFSELANREDSNTNSRPRSEGSELMSSRRDFL